MKEWLLFCICAICNVYLLKTITLNQGVHVAVLKMIEDDEIRQSGHFLSSDSVWIECRSRTHSGRVYYFNKLTGEAAWNLTESEIEKARRESQKLGKQFQHFETCPEPTEPPMDTSKYYNAQVPRMYNKQIINNQLKQPLETVVGAYNQLVPIMPVNQISPIGLQQYGIPNQACSSYVWALPPMHQIFITPSVTPLVNQVIQSPNYPQSNLPLGNALLQNNCQSQGSSFDQNERQNCHSQVSRFDQNERQNCQSPWRARQRYGQNNKSRLSCKAKNRIIKSEIRFKSSHKDLRLILDEKRRQRELAKNHQMSTYKTTRLEDWSTVNCRPEPMSGIDSKTDLGSCEDTDKALDLVSKSLADICNANLDSSNQDTSCDIQNIDASHATSNETLTKSMEIAIDDMINKHLDSINDIQNPVFDSFGANFNGVASNNSNSEDSGLDKTQSSGEKSIAAQIYHILNEQPHEELKDDTCITETPVTETSSPSENSAVSSKLDFTSNSPHTYLYRNFDNQSLLQSPSSHSALKSSMTDSPKVARNFTIPKFESSTPKFDTIPSSEVVESPQIDMSISYPLSDNAYVMDELLDYEEDDKWLEENYSPKVARNLTVQPDFECSTLKDTNPGLEALKPTQIVMSNPSPISAMDEILDNEDDNSPKVATNFTAQPDFEYSMPKFDKNPSLESLKPPQIDMSNPSPLSVNVMDEILDYEDDENSPKGAKNFTAQTDFEYSMPKFKYPSLEALKPPQSDMSNPSPLSANVMDESLDYKDDENSPKVARNFTTQSDLESSMPKVYTNPNLEALEPPQIYMSNPPLSANVMAEILDYEDDGQLEENHDKTNEHLEENTDNLVPIKKLSNDLTSSGDTEKANLYCKLVVELSKIINDVITFCEDSELDVTANEHRLLETQIKAKQCGLKLLNVWRVTERILKLGSGNQAYLNIPNSNREMLLNCCDQAVVVIKWLNQIKTDIQNIYTRYSLSHTSCI